VVRYQADALSVVLQKRDGTLWLWYHDHPLPKNSEMLGLRSFEPHRLGAESDWARILSTPGSVHAWKKDGRAWVIHSPARKPRKEEVSLLPGVVIERSANLDHFEFLCLTWGWPWHAAVRKDGTLWAWTYVPSPNTQDQSFLARPPMQIGDGSDWREVAGGDRSLTALKADGSLWHWQLADEDIHTLNLVATTPTRLGTHNDWLGVGSLMGGIVSLARDGSLWYWWGRGPNRWDNESNQPMLAPARRPTRIENILDDNRPRHASR
jgi:hypothetical protein